MNPIRVIRALAGQAVRAVAQLRRLAPGPALVRAAIAVIALAAQVLAWPVSVSIGSGTGVLIALALAVALFPGSPMPSMLIGSSLVGWLFATAGYGEALTVWRLAALAGALYLVHTLCALAALVPFDAVLDPRVIRGWLGRAVLPIGSAVVLAVAASVVQQHVGALRYLAASIVGLAVMAALAWLLAGLARGRPAAGTRPQPPGTMMDG